MGLDQHFFRYPIPDPLPPKWSDEANETVEELLYLRSCGFLDEAINWSCSSGAEPEYAGLPNGEPVVVTRKQLVQALRYMGTPDQDDHSSFAGQRLELTALLLEYPDERFVYLASW